MKTVGVSRISIFISVFIYFLIQRSRVCCIASTDKIPAGEPNILEGDILIDQRLRRLMTLDAGDSFTRQRRQIGNYRPRLWRHAVVPYIFSPNLGKTAKTVIKQAMSIIEKNSCILFTVRMAQADYVEFIAGQGCYSAIGRQGGRQVVSIGAGCSYPRLIVHELMHALGYLHEHTRYDRDLYVNILWWNIQQGAEKNFISHSYGFDSSAQYPYDYDSILHYDSRAFSKNGRRTIRSIERPGLELGSRGKLSKIDIKKLNKDYKCLRRKSRRFKLLKDCRDKLRSCKSLASFKGYCQHQKMFALLYCRRTCHLCS